MNGSTASDYRRGQGAARAARQVSIKYPDLADKAAVLIVRLAKNHALPDGNKRAAWAVLAIASGDWDEAATALWLGGYLHPPA